MIIHKTFATLAAARAHVEKRDLDGVFVVEGIGSAVQPWAVLDAGTAEDALAVQVGREKARAVLGDRDRAGSYVVRLAHYQ